MPSKKAPASQPAKSRPRDAGFLAAAFVIGAASMMLYAYFHGDLLFPITYDSASYITAARNLLLGKGSMFPTLAGAGIDLQTISLWPPGYPLLIYIFSFLCGTPTAAALFISQLSLALVPVAAFLLVRPYCTPGRALMLTLLFWTPLGIMPNAYQAGSDAPFFLLALLSTGALLRGMDAHNPRFLVLAGLIAGLSLSIRNAGLALLVAQASVLAMTNLMQRRDIRRRFQLALYWGLGTALPVGSLLLWNKVKLGTLSPYTLPPSTLSLAENTGAAMGAYVFDTFPNSTALRLTEHNSAISALLFAILICLLIAWACIRYRRDNPLSNFTLMSAIYAGLGTIMVVMARTRYQWGEPISVRHVAQYDSFLISAVLLWIVQLRRGRATGAAFVCIVFAIVCCRAWDLQARYQSLKHIPPSSALAFFSSLPEAQNLLLYYDRSPQLRALMARTSTDCYIATNLYSLTDSALGLSAHALQDEEFVALDPTYMAALNRLAEKRPSLIVLGQRRLVWNTAGTWRQALQDALPDFRLVSFDRAGLIVLESAHGGCLRAGKNARAVL